MPSSFLARFHERVAQTGSVLCMGMDLTADHAPETLGNEVKRIETYGHQLIDLAAPLVPVMKFQAAHYPGQFGAEGLGILADMVDHAKEQGLLVILDAKRNDIGNTLTMYGREVFNIIGADAVTFNGYMGNTAEDAFHQWLNDGGMAITLVRTSNDEATETQEVKLANGSLYYEYMARLVGQWHQGIRLSTDGRGAMGAVVGAPQAEQAKTCRAAAGDNVFFLIPGFGAQGGTAKEATAGILASDGTIMGTVNSSRGLTMHSWKDKKTGERKNGGLMENVRAAIEEQSQKLTDAIETRTGKRLSDTLPIA